MTAERELNNWLSYSIRPRELSTALRPAMWGNGQLELQAEINQPSISESVCFGFGEIALAASRIVPTIAEEHLVPAIYDADTGRKYLLHITPGSGAEEFEVTFRPDRQVWRFVFDDLTIELTLIMPRLQPGYLIKVRVTPQPGNPTRRWFVWQEMRGYHGDMMWATEADYDLKNSTVWFRGPTKEHCEAIGASIDAREVRLGANAQFASDIMAKIEIPGSDADGSACAYLARAFGLTTEEARENLQPLLASPETLEKETEAWWNRYLNEVPFLETPDEEFSKHFLWSWPNFRMNRIDVARDEVPAGIFSSNNCRMKPHTSIGVTADNSEAESIQLLHDPAPARDLLTWGLKATRKEGFLSSALYGGKEIPGTSAFSLPYFGGLLIKYILTTGEISILHEDIGGVTILERLEDALRVLLPYKDEATGLFRNVEEKERFHGGKGGLGPNMEAIVRYRSATDVFYNDTSGLMRGAFLVMAELFQLAGEDQKSAECIQWADDVYEAIQTHLWNDEVGFFGDKHVDGTFTDYMGIGGFLTGLQNSQVHRPGGAATKEQAEKLAAWCRHPDFVSDYGTIGLARSHPNFNPMDYKGFSGGFDMHWTNQVTAGLYAHGCYEEAHVQLRKLFRRLNENGGLGPRYRGEGYSADTGEILPYRFVNYPCVLFALTSIFSGVFGLRWTKDALTVDVNAPWSTAKLSNLRIRKSLLELELTEKGTLIATIDGKEAARSSDRKVELSWELFS
jgi:hypothetical protein